MSPAIPAEVGTRYDCGIVSPTYGSIGLFLRKESYHKDLQTTIRDELVTAVAQQVVDRDITLYKRASQVDWSQGSGQVYFSNPSRFRTGFGIDVHVPGQITVVPQFSAPVDTGAGGAGINGRGGLVAKNGLASATIFFPWTDGNYTFNVILGAPAWNTSTTPANARIGDIQTDAAQNVYFALYNNTGVWKTTSNAPGALTQYDLGATGPYSRLVYDYLKKILYGIVTPVTGARIEKINAGAAPTVIYDFVGGRLDAIEMYQGNLIIAWNTGGQVQGQSQTSRLYKYDGTNVTPFAEMPDGSMVSALKSHQGTLYIIVLETAFAGASNMLSLYTIVGTTGPNKIAEFADPGTSPEGTPSQDATTGTLTGAGTFVVAGGTSVFVPLALNFWRYDTAVGGVSRSFGAPSYISTNHPSPGAGGSILGGVNFRDGLYTVASQGIFLVSGTSNGLSTIFVSWPKLTSSRLDLGLPYVQKYWYGLEVILKRPLNTGESIEMEYSLDDGATFTTCSNSPWSTVGPTRFTFLVQQQNAHLTYRVRLNPAAAGSAGPAITGISARCIIANPSASVYKMTVMAYDEIRDRGNSQDQPGYGLDTIAFLENIARKGESVTFYELDDQNRTAHTVWVMDVKRVSPSGGTYQVNRQEGDVAVTLWEVV